MPNPTRPTGQGAITNADAKKLQAAAPRPKGTGVMTDNDMRTFSQSGTDVKGRPILGRR